MTDEQSEERQTGNIYNNHRVSATDVVITMGQYRTPAASVLATGT